MTENDYIDAVNSVLAEYSEGAIRRIRETITVLPQKATRMTFDVFVDQDGEGFLDVRIGLDGPDLFVLNKAISAHADLFKTRMTESGLNPPLPQMDSQEEAFSVQHTLTDCAAKWIATIWKEHGLDSPIPVEITSPEGYGTVFPMVLR